MKIIVRVDSDDPNVVENFMKGSDKEMWTIPQGEHIKVFVINNNGDVEELK